MQPHRLIAYELAPAGTNTLRKGLLGAGLALQPPC
jgi:hypothetical protein